MLRGPESHEALRIISDLRKAGFIAYLAGGCVRDALLQIPPKDFDVATDATPQAIRKVFGRGRTIAFGAAFGVIGVLPRRSASRAVESGDGAESRAKVQPIEVATFRSDGFYSDGRRPDSVHFGDAKHDALRRDFTINGLFFDPHTDEIIDYVGGQRDLQARVLRTIGEPRDRFQEDKLRMLRAVRFATTLEFQIDSGTFESIVELASEISIVSGERIGAEMRRTLTSLHAVQGIEYLSATRLHDVVLPELTRADLVRMRAVSDQLAERPFPSCLATFLLTIQDADAALGQIAKRWRLSNEEVRQTRAILRHWPTIAQADRLPWSKVQPVLLDRDASLIIPFADAVVCADDQDRGGIELAIDAMGWPPDRLNPPPLLTGDDLRQLGFPAGPQYREWLQRVRDAQLDGQVTSRDQAIAMIQGEQDR